MINPEPHVSGRETNDDRVQHPGTFVVEARASRDDAGHDPTPRLTGPFESAADARRYMALTYPILHGEWAVAYVAAPEPDISEEE